MDVLAVISIISASSALLISVLMHVKYSTCCGFSVRTTESHTPVEDRAFFTNERQHNNTPVYDTVFHPIESQPIEIPKEDVKTRLINERRHRL